MAAIFFFKLLVLSFIFFSSSFLSYSYSFFFFFFFCFTLTSVLQSYQLVSVCVQVVTIAITTYTIAYMYICMYIFIYACESHSLVFSCYGIQMKKSRLCSPHQFLPLRVLYSIFYLTSLFSSFSFFFFLLFYLDKITITNTIYLFIYGFRQTSYVFFFSRQ